MRVCGDRGGKVNSGVRVDVMEEEEEEEKKEEEI